MQLTVFDTHGEVKNLEIEFASDEQPPNDKRSPRLPRGGYYSPHRNISKPRDHDE